MILIEKNNIYNECCVLGMKKMRKESVDLVVTSPPYDDLREYHNNNAWNFEFFKKVAYEIKRILKPGGVIVWNVNDQTINGRETLSSFRQALYFNDVLNLGMHDTMIYQKTGVAFASGAKSVRYTPRFEYVFVISKGRPKTVNLIMDKKNKYAGHKSWGNAATRLKNGDIKKSNSKTKQVKDYGVRDNIWIVKNSGGFGQRNKNAYAHPATMPESLARDHILSWSEKGDTVLDPFLGSGTTARMAMEQNRHYIGFEIDKEYCQIAIQLLEKQQKII